MDTVTLKFCQELLFCSLTVYQLEYELQVSKARVCDRLHDDTLQQYLQNIAIEDDPQWNYINCIYYDDDQFNENLGSINSDIGVFHMNIRKLSKHRG